ncbi:MAG: YicC/YloC family endoribonuclease [Hyphomicrobiaceae bacterium]
MSVKSMTGFARTDGSFGLTRWAWEVRAVNGRNLDVRLRLPPGFDHLEPRVREVAAGKFLRGSIQVGLNVKRDEGITRVQLNEEMLAQAIAAAQRVRDLTGAPAATVEAILGVKGVLETIEVSESEAEAEAKTASLLATLQQALDGVVGARLDEGRRLQKVLLEQVNEIERITTALETNPSRSVTVVKRRLAEQVAKLIESSSSFDPARLHQEAVLLASKADVEEELKRLQAHVASARDLLQAKDGVGRKLDFLSQEFNREANTVCSKANDSGMTTLGLSLKSVIEQFREQVQNIE